MISLTIAKRRWFIGLLALLAVLSLAINPHPAAAASNTFVNIYPQAQLWAFFPQWNGVYISLTYRCSGGTGGSIDVTVTQTAQQSSAGTPSSGMQSTSVTCDGTSHQVSVSVLADTGPDGFNQGTADVTASLNAPSGTDPRTVQVNHP